MVLSSTARIPPQASAFRKSATVSAWTLVSRVTGLGRVIVIGAVLGPTFLANSFVTTNVMPNLAYLAIAGSVLSAVVVPAIVRTTVAAGNRGAVYLLGQLGGFLLRIAGAASVLLLVGSPLIARLLTFGIADAATRSRAEQLTVVMILFIAPQIMLYMIAALGAAAQQARGRFALAAAAPAVENVGVIATVAAVGCIFGTGAEMDDAPMGLVILLCLGSTLSVALHTALQLIGAARVGLPIRPRPLRRSDSVTLEVTHRIGQSIVVAASPCIAYFALLALAATVPGGVLVVQMAYHVYALPVALGARAVSTAVMPGLSVAAGASDREMFNEKVREGIAYTFIASLPPLFLMVAFASPIADILANGRLRVEELIQALAGCVVVLAVAQVAAGLREVCLQGLFARLDVRRPRIIALSGLGVMLTTGLTALHGLDGAQRLVGLSCAVLAGDAAAAVTAVLLLQRAVRPEGLVDRRRLAAATVASTVMLPVVAGGWLLIEVLADNRIQDFLVMGLTSILALGLFALLLRKHTTARLAVAT